MNQPTIFSYSKDNFTVNISFDINLIGEEEKEQLIADSFGLGYHTQKFVVYDNFSLNLDKQIYFITGDSGSGKSLLLKYLKETKYKDEYIDFSEIEIDKNEKLYTITDSLDSSLRYLSAIGLGDAFLFLNKYCNLSDGQKTRYKLLKCLLSDKKIIFVDEFLATLDRESAQVVAFNLQKIMRKDFKDKKIFLATTHSDLIPYIQADYTIKKLYGDKSETLKYESCLYSENPFLTESNVELNKQKGMELWKDIFSVFHYRSHKIPFIVDIAILNYKNTPIGIIVYKHGSYKINKPVQDTTRISRVVLLPKYRGVGLAHYFVKEANRLFFDAHKEFNSIDTIALMANYNKFFEKGGMKEIDTFYPNSFSLELKKYLDEKKINFFKFRIDKEYALQNLDDNIRKMLTKIYIDKKRSYTSFNATQELPDINKELEKFLVYLEVLQPKKYMLERQNDRIQT